jgi:hypothetical protein
MLDTESLILALPLSNFKMISKVNLIHNVNKMSEKTREEIDYCLKINLVGKQIQVRLMALLCSTLRDRQFNDFIHIFDFFQNFDFINQCADLFLWERQDGRGFVLFRKLLKGKRIVRIALGFC